MVDENYVYVYLVDMPPQTHEIVTPCADGYTVYINATMDDKHRIEAYKHALRHIENGDFDIDNIATVQEIEAKAHGIKIEINKKRKRLIAALKRKERQARFLQSQGYDLFLSAENQYLEPR